MRRRSFPRARPPSARRALEWVKRARRLALVAALVLTSACAAKTQESDAPASRLGPCKKDCATASQGAHASQSAPANSGGGDGAGAPGTHASRAPKPNDDGNVGEMARAYLARPE